MADLIATVDASKAFSTDPRELAAYDRALVESFRSSGFALLDVTGVGYNQAQEYARLFDWMEQFFALPIEAKLPFVDQATGGERGFTFGKETAIGRTAADIKQFLMFGEERDIADRATLAYPENVYPEGLVPGYDVKSLMQGVRRIQGDIALHALHLPIARTFGYDPIEHTERVRAADSPLRLLYYPADPSLTVGQEIGGAHTDIDAVTLLPSTPKHDLKGLELQLAGSTEWIPVQVDPGRVVVNLGDLYQWFLGGELPSTRHRVVCTEPGKTRLSAPYFSHFRKATPICESFAFPGEMITEDRALDMRLAAINMMPESAFVAKHGEKYLAEVAYDRTHHIVR